MVTYSVGSVSTWTTTGPSASRASLRASASSPTVCGLRTLVAVVLDQDDDDPDPLGHGRDQLPGVHQVAGVADHGEHLAAGVGHPDPDRPGDLVAHAGVAVLQVELLGVAGPPQLVQVAGHAPGGADDHVAGLGGVVDGPDDLALAGQGPVPGPVDPLHGLVPGPVVLGRGPLPVGVGPPAGQGLGQRLQGRPGVGHHRGGGVLEGVHRGHVDVDEPDLGIGEDGVGGGGEVGPAGAHPHDHVGLPRHGVGPVGPGHADGSQGRRVVIGHRALAGVGLGHRDAGRLDQGPEGAGGLGVDDPAPGHQQRPVGPPQHLDRPGQHGRLGHGPGHVPDPPGEQLLGVVEGLGLDVLGQGQGDRAGLGRVGQHPHGLQQRAGELVGPVDPVPVARHRLEGVVGADVGPARRLLLLEHGRRHPGGEDVARQQQHRQPVDGGRGRPGDHVGRPRADRGGAGEGGQAVAVLGVAGGDVDHALLVAGHVVGEPVGVLAQGLAHAGHVPVAEDPEAAGEQALLLAVALAVLAGQELDQGLGRGQPPCLHVLPPALVIGSRGSIGWPSQVPRTQAWAGSSQKRQARSSAGPAMTLR